MANNGSGTLLVTGASGNLGRRVVELLVASGQHEQRRIVATTRTPEKLADLGAEGIEVRAASFEDPSSLAVAFAGVERVLIVSTDALDRVDRRIEQHANAVNAAKAAGVRHIVYTSLTNPGSESLVTIAPDHRRTEELIAASGLGYAFLRNNMYTDYLLHHLSHEIAAGKIVNAYGEGAVGYVTREDCARAAAASLASSFEGRAVYDITGPSAVTQAELAEVVSQITGKRVAYVAVDGDTSKRNAVAAGLPAPVAELLVSFELAGAKGQLGVAPGAVQALTGVAPASVRDFLVVHRAALG